MARALKNKNTQKIKPSAEIKPKSVPEVEGSLEAYSKEVLQALIKEGLSTTPNNFSLYFDRLLEEKSQNTKKNIMSILDSEKSNDDENSMVLEQSLKQGFSSVKNILSITANLYKNMVLMTKILDKKKQELQDNSDSGIAKNIVTSLENDILKLSSIIKKQSFNIKDMYDKTAKIVKNVENETIFDNQYGVFNKRNLMTKLEREIEQIGRFKHKSSLIMIELSRDLKDNISNEKAIMLMTKTIARLLLKTSRRSDIVAHYGNGIFAMLLKHTDIESAKKASERLCDLVSNSNFFLADKEIQLQISIGITDVTKDYSVEEIVVSSMDAIEKAYESTSEDYAVLLRDAQNK
ncbi:MAG: GGDEF domain-containing protein [Sulfurimonas sp.]|nr:GGDEF domain-containing protein [Sulfurimonas sp.]